MIHTRFFHLIATALLVVISGAATHASLLVIPYSGDKIAGTTVITVNSASSVTPDTIRFGNREATIHFNLQSNVLPAVCGAKPTMVARFSGVAAAIWQLPDSSTDWNALTWFQGATSLRTNLPLKAEPDDANPLLARAWYGYPLFSAGPDHTCSGAEYFMAPHWNRVVFMHFGNGDFRGRFSFQVKHDTSYAPTPMLQYHVLKSLTLHYVIAEESNDLSGAPVSLRRPTPSRASGAVKAGGVEALYNPLGVKVREPGRFQAVVPLRR